MKLKDQIDQWKYKARNIREEAGEVSDSLEGSDDSHPFNVIFRAADELYEAVKDCANAMAERETAASADSQNNPITDP